MNRYADGYCVIAVSAGMSRLRAIPMAGSKNTLSVDTARMINAARVIRDTEEAVHQPMDTGAMPTKFGIAGKRLFTHAGHALPLPAIFCLAMLAASPA
ncbi:hypothetical protein [Paraburkholderia sp. ZP32-5]|uniref:hypothetical protein n=1 Tax=Paraburkholderia sp. ZP32-5 TaxID=2883245 RepID=UPI001F225758|nr:hypothetical protein [Paraburkholderia sp. ZP32-5]